MISPELLNTLEKLPEPLQQQVLHYAEFLAEKYSKTTAQTATPNRQGFGSL